MTMNRVEPLVGDKLSIKPIYLADAVGHSIFAGAWMMALTRRRRATG
jgi:hypothetical protein